MRAFIAGILLLAALASAAPGQAEDAVSGPALLTVSGRISNPNQGDLLVLDEAALAALPQVTVTTETPWTEGPTVFEGVSLAAILERAGADGTIIHAIALNDYAVDIPATDATDHRIIVARRMNGAPMRVRDHGPLWIIYPLSAESGYRTEETHSKMIWQLNRLEIR